MHGEVSEAYHNHQGVHYHYAMPYSQEGSMVTCIATLSLIKTQGTNYLDVVAIIYTTYNTCTTLHFLTRKVLLFIIYNNVRVAVRPSICHGRSAEMT